MIIPITSCVNSPLLPNKPPKTQQHKTTTYHAYSFVCQGLGRSTVWMACLSSRTLSLGCLNGCRCLDGLMKPCIWGLGSASQWFLVLSHAPSAGTGLSTGLLTLMRGPWAGMVRTAAASQLWLCFSVQPFHVTSLGFLTAWQSQGSQVQQLASPQAIFPIKRKWKLPVS